MGLKAGERVLTTPLSAFATTLAILRAGGVPVFADVDERGLIDLDLCEQLFVADPTLRFLVPVHLYGYPLDLERLARLRSRFGLSVLEDCAQSVMAQWGDTPAGAAGQVGATSFYPTKNLGALGDGGAIVTDDEELRSRCASLRDYGQTARYVHDHLGLNSRLDELHAAILKDAFLPRLAAWTERRRAIARRYLAGIRHPRVRTLTVAPKARPCWHLFPVFVPRAERDGFRRHLEDRGIQSAVHYPRLITEQRALTTALTPEVQGPLDVARALASGEVSLPIHPYLLDEEVDTILEAVNGWPCV
jgi:dTDP-3-amino-3,4,6-trideoxy-alpha-D-glucose transaminase